MLTTTLGLVLAVGSMLFASTFIAIEATKFILSIKARAWFEHYGGGETYSEDPKIFLDWYGHAKRWPYKGFTIRVGLFHHVVLFTVVNDIVKYHNRYGDNKRRWDKVNAILEKYKPGGQDE